MNGYSKTKPLAIPFAFWLLAACGDGDPPLREWTPADHGHPAGTREGPAAEGAETPTASDENAPPAQPQHISDARSGAALWNVMCAGCHGRQGRGDGPARPVGTRMPDLSDPSWQSSRSDQQIMRFILSGQGAMASMQERVDAAALRPLVRYIRGLARKGDR